MDAFTIFGLQTAATLVTYALAAKWYVWPRLAAMPRASALTPLLLIHTLRTLGLTVIVPAVTDPKLPQSFSAPLAYGDLFATALAFLALAAVRLRWPFALALVWLFSVEGSLDLVNAVVQGIAIRATDYQLGAACGIPTDPLELGRWFHASAASGSLALYLRGFAHTIAVMQTPEAVERVAYECGEDLAADGVVYAEIRYAPVFHLERGLNLEQVVQSVARGFERAERDHVITLRQIVAAMRDRTDSLEMAELAVANQERGVIGFDIAGEEAGHPPKAHLAAFEYCRRENFNITIHAGEGFGPPSIWQALQYCGAHRIGHGVRLVEDMAIVGGLRPPAPGDSGEAHVVKLGPLATYVRDKRIPLELCPSSNVDTGAVPSLEEHPIRHFIAQRFRVTVNTDNRLMSNVTLSEEFSRLSRVVGLSLGDVERLSINAMKTAL